MCWRFLYFSPFYTNLQLYDTSSCDTLKRFLPSIVKFIMASKRASEECDVSDILMPKRPRFTESLSCYHLLRRGKSSELMQIFQTEKCVRIHSFWPSQRPSLKSQLQSATQKCVETIFLNEHAQIEKSPKGFEIPDSHTTTSDIKLTDLVSIPNSTSVNVTKYFTTWNSNSQDWEIILKARLSCWWLYNLLSFSSGYPSCKTKIGTVDGLDVECTKCRLMLKHSKCKH